MFGLHFLNAAFLAGLGAVALPILIHLVHRRRAKEVPFSSLRYLIHIDERVARRHRLQELAILAMRCGALAFVALALAKPLFRPEGSPVGGRGATTAVLVVDDSYSMGVAESGVTLFEQARSSAAAIAKSLRPGDQAIVLAPHHMPSSEEMRVLSDLGAIAKDVASIRLSHEPTVIAPTIGAAYEILSKATTPCRELYVFSDLQVNGWEPVLEDQQAGSASGFGDRPSGVDVYLVPLGGGEVHDLGVTEVQAVAAGGLREAPVWVTALITNQGKRDEEGRLSVIVDGRSVAEQAVRAARGETVPVALTLPPQAPGQHRGVVRLSGDSLAEDNERGFVVDIRDALSVLLVNGRPARTNFDNATYYLERALRPEVQADESRSAIVPEVCKAEEVASRSLASYSVVLLSDVPSLSAEAAKALTDWVRGGGALVVFFGPDTKLAEWNETISKTGLMPLRLASIAGTQSGEEVFFTMKDLAPRHPLLSSLSRSRPPVDLTTPRFFRYAKASVVGDAQVVARFSGGDPALVEARCGTGRVFVCLSACTPEWTNFPLRVSFLPFVHNLVYWLSEGERGAEEVRVGAPLRFVYPAASAVRGVSVTLPDGKEVVKARTGTAAWEAVFEPVRDPGFVSWKEEGGDARAETLAVNVDPAEADLARVSKDEAEKAFPAGSVRFLAPGAAIASERERSRNGIPLADAFLLVALVLFLGELFLANRIAFGVRTRAAATPESAELSEAPKG